MSKTIKVTDQVHRLLNQVKSKYDFASIDATLAYVLFKHVDIDKELEFLP